MNYFSSIASASNLTELTENPADDNQSSGNSSDALGLMLVTFVLLAFGLVMMQSASSINPAKAVQFFRNQILWSVLGLAAGSVVFVCGYKTLAKYSYIWIGIISILLIWARLSRKINGAYRWIHIGPYTLQPSELAKIVLALFIAWYCSEYLRTFYRWQQKHGIIKLGAVIALVLGLIILGHDLGTTLLVASVAYFTLIVAGLPWYYWGIPIVVAVPGILYLKYFDPMRWARMTVFMNPEIYQDTSGYQLWMSVLALGSGHWTGVGLMASRLKAKYLPEAHTDFVLAVIGEELGFIGICSIFLLYTLWGIFAVRIALRAADRLGMLLAWALTVGIMLQAAINIGAMSGFFPTKGMPAPFISYGGSNLLGCMIATGFLISISSESTTAGYAEKWFGFLRFRRNNNLGEK